MDQEFPLRDYSVAKGPDGALRFESGGQPLQSIPPRTVRNADCGCQMILRNVDADGTESWITKHTINCRAATGKRIL